MYIYIFFLLNAVVVVLVWIQITKAHSQSNEWNKLPWIGLNLNKLLWSNENWTIWTSEQTLEHRTFSSWTAFRIGKRTESKQKKFIDNVNANNLNIFPPERVWGVCVCVSDFESGQKFVNRIHCDHLDTAKFMRPVFRFYRPTGPYCL